MKKLCIIIIAAVLFLGLGQCKKTEAPITPNHVTEEGWVHITVKVGDNSKHEVDPNTGVVSFTNGDILYVGNNGKYVGQLEYSSTTHAFTGDLLESALSTNDYLHFYFAGGLSVTGLTAGETTSFNVDIHDQSQKLPVLSYGASEERYTSEEATYTIFLENKCGLVRFGLVSSTDSNVTVNGVKTAATFDFGHPSNPIVATGNDGAITLFPQTGTALWALMLPRDAMDATVTVDNAPYDVNIPAVEPNSYITSGITIVNGTLPLFSVAADKKVVFSKGNLQYCPAGHTWRFAPHQYDMIFMPDEDELAEWGSCWINAEEFYSENYNGWVDLFAWGTWSSRSTDPLYHSTNYYYYNDYGDYVDEYYDPDPPVYLNFIGHDFGTQMAGSGEFEDYDWFTLTSEEWQYLFEGRSNASTKYGTAMVAGVRGVILLPDEWEGGTLTLNTDHTSYENNVITAAAWDSDWEDSGAVFLPATGYRDYEGYVGIEPDYGSFYWSFSDCYIGGYFNDTFVSSAMRIYKEGYQGVEMKACENGYAVRLVYTLDL